jgi:tetratricopeptide (TPR) repeat protein
MEAITLLNKSISRCPSNHVGLYHLALLYADCGNLHQSKHNVKLSLKQSKAHIPSWHLLVLLLTANGDLDGAIRFAEIGARESILAHLTKTRSGSSSIKTGVISTAEASSGIVKSATTEHLSALSREQQHNQTWCPSQFDEFISALFELKLTQSRILERVKGMEHAIAVVQELFRWYRMAFDEDTVPSAPPPASSASPDNLRLRAESVASTTSGWSLSMGDGNYRFRIKSRRKRTMLTSALLNQIQSQTGANLNPDIEVTEEDGSRKPPDSSNGGIERTHNMSTCSLASMASDTPSLGAITSAQISSKRAMLLSKLWLRLAQILRASGQIAEARKALKEAESLLSLLSVRKPREKSSPRNANSASALSSSWEMDLPSTSLQDNIWSELAAILYSSGQNENSVALWYKSLSRDPNFVPALLGLARHNMDSEKYLEAELILDDLVSHSGWNSVDAWYGNFFLKIQLIAAKVLSCSLLNQIT